MSEQAPEPEASAAPAQGQPGFFERQIEKVLPHVEGEGAHAAAGVKTILGDLTDHSSAVYDFTGDFLDAVKLIDPGDAAAVAAFQALVPKAITVAGKVSALLSGALKSA